MQEISVFLIGQGSIFKEGVKALLEKNSFRIVENSEVIPEQPIITPAQLVVNIDDKTEDLPGKIEKMRKCYTKSRIVIISGREAMPPHLPEFAANIDALILKDISCDGLIGALRLTVAGEKVYPTCMLSQVQAHPDMPAVNCNQPANNVYPCLSRQELKIVHCLANGQPNKVIAQYLDITESTVKVHVKTILRKMGAANRTQAAIFAISQGIATAPAAEARLSSSRG